MSAPESRFELAWRMSVEGVYYDDAVDAYHDQLLEDIAQLPERLRRRLGALKIAAKMLGAGGGIDPLASAEALARETCALAERVLAEWDALRLEELRTMAYADYLQTPEWRERRQRALARAGHRCQVCNSAGLLDVHHHTYERRGAEADGDVVVLCRGCHSLFHALSGVEPSRRYSG